MLAKATALLKKIPIPPFRRGGRIDVYQPGDRLIYKYFNGEKQVWADPLTLYKKMMDVGPELSVNIKISSSPSKAAGQAYTEMIGQIRGIFDIKPLEEGGLTELETAGLLDHFLAFCEIIKKNSSTSPISSSSSEESTVSSEANPPTPSSSDSGSIASAVTTDVPPWLQQVQESPSEPANPD